jgi:hypothetical protein
MLNPGMKRQQRSSDVKKNNILAILYTNGGSSTEKAEALTSYRENPDCN